MSTEDWLFEGSDGEAEAARLAAERKLRSEERKFPPRFWLKEGASAQVTFLDDGIYVNEHRWYDPRTREWHQATCLGQDCPLCEARVPRSFTGFFTVIDHSRYVSTRDPNKVYENTKKILFVRGQSATEKIKRKRERCQPWGPINPNTQKPMHTLKYAKLQFTRDTDKEASCGEDIEIISTCNNDTKQSMEATLLALKPTGIEDADWLAGVDFREYLKRRSIDDLRRLVAQSPPVGSERGLYHESRQQRTPATPVPPSATDSDLESQLM